MNFNFNRIEKVDPTTVYLSNLPFWWRQADLHKFFTKYYGRGAVYSIEHDNVRPDMAEIRVEKPSVATAICQDSPLNLYEQKVFAEKKKRKVSKEKPRFRMPGEHEPFETSFADKSFKFRLPQYRPREKRSLSNDFRKQDLRVIESKKHACDGCSDASSVTFHRNRRSHSSRSSGSSRSGSSCGFRGRRKSRHRSAYSNSRVFRSRSREAKRKRSHIRSRSRSRENSTREKGGPCLERSQRPTSRGKDRASAHRKRSISAFTEDEPLKRTKSEETVSDVNFEVDKPIMSLSSYKKSAKNVWIGGFILKHNTFTVSAHFLSGNFLWILSKLNKYQKKNFEITQRMRLIPSKVDEVTGRIGKVQNCGTLLAYEVNPTNNDQNSLSTFSKYLKDKGACAVVSDDDLKIYVFPECDTAREIIEKANSRIDLNADAGGPDDYALLMVVVENRTQIA